MGTYPDCRNDVDKGRKIAFSFYGVLSPFPISEIKL